MMRLSFNVKIKRFCFRLFLLLICISSAINLYSQRNAEEYFPKPPDAASIGKFIDIPAGNYTGTASFTIPLFDIDFDGVKVPFNISYHASGIKVAEIASRVGLGWTLNLGGVSLSGQIMGSKDAASRFVISNNFDPIVGSPDYNMTLDILGIGDDYQWDTQPDIFSYSTFSNQGEFIVDSGGNFGIPRPFNLNKISSVINGGVSIVDEQGFKYKFIDEGTIKSNTNCSPPDLKLRTSYNFQPTEIESPAGKKITYNYSSSLNVNSKYFTSLVQNEKIEDLKLGSNDSLDFTILPPAQICYNYNSHTERLVDKITLPDGQVDLIYNNNTTEPRQDLPGDFYVKQIILRDKNNHIIKDFTFNYGYFTSPGGIPTTPISGIADGTNKRLKLLSVVDNMTQSKYEMKYYGDSENKTLPNRMSNSYDYWGVYNGKNNQTSIATTIYKKSRYDVSPIKRLFVGADKQPDFNFGKIGNLQEIIYPTGGSTKITYEADDFVKEPFVGPIYSYEQVFSNDVLTWGNMDNNYIDFTIEKDPYEFNLKFYSEDKPQTEFPPIAEIGDCKLYLYKYPNITNPILSMPSYYPANQSHELFNTLTPGTYKLYITSGFDQNSFEKFHCTAYAQWYEQTLVGNPEIRKAGTIRIKKIEKTDNNNVKITREYNYGIPNGSGSYSGSSGINTGDQYFTSIASSKFPRNTNGGYIERTWLTNNPGWNLSTVAGKAIGYTYVQEEYKNTSTNESFRKEYTFYNEDNHINNLEPYSFIKRPYPQKNFKRGFLLNEKTFSSNNELVRSVVNEEPNLDPYFNYLSTASPDGNLLLWGLEIYNSKIERIPPNHYFYYFDYELFNINNYWVKDIKSTITDYLANGKTLVTEQTTDYSTAANRHTFPIGQTTTVTGSNETTTQSYQYAHDLNQTYLKDKNIIGIPLTTEVKKNGETISKIETVYPVSEADAKSRNLGNKDIPVPFDVFSRILGSSEMQKKITYNKYDDKGNLVQYTLNESNTPTTIIWGYNQTRPIAKIEGATYAQVSSPATAIVNAANTDAAAAPGNDETSLLNALNTFRTSFPNYQVTTYTYDPLIGVRSITPPSGITEFYNYDTAGRLKEIRDINGSLLKEFKYNYKH